MKHFVRQTALVLPLFLLGITPWFIFESVVDASQGLKAYETVGLWTTSPWLLIPWLIGCLAVCSRCKPGNKWTKQLIRVALVLGFGCGLSFLWGLTESWHWTFHPAVPAFLLQLAVSLICWSGSSGTSRWRQVVRFTTPLLTALSIVLAALILFPPRPLLNWLQQRSGVIFHVPGSVDTIALTIDDGPLPGHQAIRDLLDDKGASATFFLVGGHLGQETDEPTDFVRLLHQQGHEWGNHQDTVWVGAFMSHARLEREIEDVDELVGPDFPTKWFRPGNGLYHSEMIKIAARHDHKVVLGSVFPLDVRHSSVIFSSFHIVTRSQPGDIIILHEGSSRGPRTAQVLQNVLPILQAKGFQVGTVSELVSQERVKPLNQ